jgi:AcrR family transcriptional regulator
MTASTPGRRRDAAGTRRALLEAARQRFARNGYSATTVRDIADDAGVNVALINRYFESKEGLFEACLAVVVDELGRSAGEVSELSQLPGTIAQRVAGVGPDGHPNQAVMMLLLRSSGEERTERMRLGVLRQFTERVASVAGWHPDEPDDDRLMLRAQLLFAVSLGITVLRSSSGLDPLASATEEDLAGPLREIVDALFSHR